MAAEAEAKFIILGSGTSEGVPRISCLTKKGTDRCQTCENAADASSPDRRRNTSGVLLVRDPSSPPGARPLSILIDCGKRFWDGAIDHFPRIGLRHIDAVVLTHDHADAVAGLDDLRDFTCNVDPLEGVPGDGAQGSGASDSTAGSDTAETADAAADAQDPAETAGAGTKRKRSESAMAMEEAPFLPVFVSPRHFGYIEKAFPYLVDQGRATGGGKVPKLRFFPIRDNLTREEIAAKAASVKGDAHASDDAAAAAAAAAAAGAPLFGEERWPGSRECRCGPGGCAVQFESAAGVGGESGDVGECPFYGGLASRDAVALHSNLRPVTRFSVLGVPFCSYPVKHGFLPSGEPYYCNAFSFGDLLYVSDTSGIPRSTGSCGFLVAGGSPSNPDRGQVTSTTAAPASGLDSGEGCASGNGRFSTFVIDSLRPEKPHPSHFSLVQAAELAASESWGARFSKTVCVGMCHELAHPAEGKGGTIGDVLVGYDGLELPVGKVHWRGWSDVKRT